MGAISEYCTWAPCLEEARGCRQSPGALQQHSILLHLTNWFSWILFSSSWWKYLSLSSVVIKHYSMFLQSFLSQVTFKGNVPDRYIISSVTFSVHIDGILTAGLPFRSRKYSNATKQKLFWTFPSWKSWKIMKTILSRNSNKMETFFETLKQNIIRSVK